MKRIPELDGLRGLAILLVLVWHYLVSALKGPPHTFESRVLVSLHLTWSGVDLFFVLSGFLIGGILLDVRQSPRYFQTFYFRRFFRIVPVYALMLISFWIISGTAHHGPAAGWLFDKPFPWFAYATFTQNLWMAAKHSFGPYWLGVTWSLAVEEQFYLTLPFAIKLLSKSALQRLLPLAILAAPLLRSALILGWQSGRVATYVLMPCRADALLVGVAAALLARDDCVLDYLSRHSRQLIICLLLLATGIPYLIYFSRGGMFSSFFLISIGYTWLALFYGCLLLLAVTQTGSTLTRILRTRVLIWLGSISYGVYLLHQVIRGLVFHFATNHEPAIGNLSDLAITFAALALTLILATLSWSFFEAPMQKIGHSLKY